MAGRFEGVTDSQWAMLQPLFDPEQPGEKLKGRPKTPRRRVVNSILYPLITGSRWCDLPQGPQWAPRSTAHRWLGVWKEDGTLQRALDSILAAAELKNLIDWSAASVDGSFSPR